MFSSKRHELDAFIARSQRANKVRELEMFLDEFKRKDDPKPTETPKVRWELKAARSLPFRKLDTSRKFVGALHRLNLSMQARQPMFRMIEQYVKSKRISDHEDDTLHHMQQSGDRDSGVRAKRRLKELIVSECNKCIAVPGQLEAGAMGEIPVHVAYLLGEHELGQEMLRSAASRLAFLESLAAADPSIGKEGSVSGEELMNLFAAPSKLGNNMQRLIMVRLWCVDEEVFKHHAQNEGTDYLNCHNDEHEQKKIRCEGCDRLVCTICEFRPVCVIYLYVYIYMIIYV